MYFKYLKNPKWFGENFWLYIFHKLESKFKILMCSNILLVAYQIKNLLKSFQLVQECALRLN